MQLYNQISRAEELLNQLKLAEDGHKYEIKENKRISFGRRFIECDPVVESAFSAALWTAKRKLKKRLKLLKKIAVYRFAFKKLKDESENDIYGDDE